MQYMPTFSLIHEFVTAKLSVYFIKPIYKLYSVTTINIAGTGRYILIIQVGKEGSSAVQYSLVHIRKELANHHVHSTK